MIGKPKISVVIPAYNESRFIADCLDSLKKQDIKTKFEIIVVDNNSTDSTASVARSFGARVVKEKRKGVCAAREAGLRAARGQIIVTTDADTVFLPNWLSNIDKTFDKKKALAVAGPVRYSEGPMWGRVWARILFGTVNLSSKVIGRPYYVSACNLAFKKEFFGGYNTELTQGGDELDVLRRIKKHGKVIYLPNNYTTTSSRRFVRGLFYNLFVSFLVFYVLDYFIGRITKKSPFGSWHDYRTEVQPRVLLVAELLLTSMIVGGFLLLTPQGRYIYRHTYDYVVRFSKEDK